MSRILITGGSGGLGREVVARMNLDRNIVRIMSRGNRPEKLDKRIEWVQADLKTGDGVAEAVAGSQTILHLASQPFTDNQKVDIEGTRHLLELARKEQLRNFVYISIVGIERFPKFSYYKAKVAAERLIEESGVPYTILRATQFHSFIDFFISAANRLPIIFLPTEFQVQPIDTGEVAASLVQLAADAPSGRVPDMAGPEVLRVGDMIRTWLKIRGIRKPVVNLPLPGATFNAYRRGLNTEPNRAVGKITWAEWVAREYDTAHTYVPAKASR